jgi:hypothetical protein
MRCRRCQEKEMLGSLSVSGVGKRRRVRMRHEVLRNGHYLTRCPNYSLRDGGFDDRMGDGGVCRGCVDLRDICG